MRRRTMIQAVRFGNVAVSRRTDIDSAGMATAI
jgi:hypothetical protein